MAEETKSEDQQFNQHFIQLALGLQSTAWIALGKVTNPHTGKAEVNLEMARDSIDTLLMLKEKTKNNLTETEKTFLESAMQDLELNYVEVSKDEEKKTDSKERDNAEKEDISKKEKDENSL